MASTHVYFRPVEEEGIVSSTFRGRGLLALPPEKLRTEEAYLPAGLFSLQDDQIQVKADIDQIYEWHHEHNPESLHLEQTGGGGSSRLQMAREWSEVALAVREEVFLTRR